MIVSFRVIRVKRKKAETPRPGSPMPSVPSEGGPAGGGCGGDPYRRRSGFVEWYQPLVRVGDDAHIVPKVRQQSSTFVLTDSARKVSGRCGHRPLREREPFSIHRDLSWTFRGPLHTRHGFAVPPSPRRGFLCLFCAYRVISPAKSFSNSSAMPWGVRPWPRPHMSLV